MAKINSISFIEAEFTVTYTSYDALLAEAASEEVFFS